MDIKEPSTIVPILILSKYEENGTVYPCAQLLNQKQDIAFSYIGVAASLVSCYEAFIQHVPENIQIQFEEGFKHAFMAMLENRHEYMKTISTTN